MSEPIPESIPTSQDPRSKRPTKRLALTPTNAQAASLATLFSNPSREIALPPPLPSSSSASNSTFQKPALPPPPEIVANVQGSSAGAGSGEFHVYKASRRREYERIKLMEGEVERESADRDFEKKREEMKRIDEARTEKRRRKRGKVAAKRKGGKGVGPGKENGEGDQRMGNGDSGTGAKEGQDGNQLPAMIIDEEKGVVIHDDEDDLG